MSRSIASFDRVTKEYRLGQERSNLRNLVPGRWGETNSSQLFRVLDDVSFEVAPGEAVGIIGANGAGKSTALKLLANVLEPTSGTVHSEGRVASLIELGVGFDPELTGNENIEFAGQLHGLSRRELRDARDWIVEFSGIEAFLDMPVKRYSTGMSARLGFALSTAIQPDLLLVDEVLSVGDLAFQKRSFSRIHELNDAGAALVLVSHNLWMMGTLCDRLLLLEQGRLIADGPANEVISAYVGAAYEFDADDEFEAARYYDYAVPASIRGTISIDAMRATPDVIAPGAPVTVRARITVREPIDGTIVLSIFTAERAVFAEREAGPSSFLSTPGTWDLEVQISSLPLNTGRYDIRLAILPEDDLGYEQIFPAALAFASDDVVVDASPTARPGIKLDLDWRVTRPGVVQEV